MKKIICAAFVILTAMGMSSCKKWVNDIKSAEPGVDIYLMARRQQDYALDPVKQAFMLNALLTEASEQGKLDDLDNISVTRGGTTVNVKKELFGDVEITKEYNIYNIKYTEETDKEKSRDGILMIDTGGKLLDDLSGTEGWKVSAMRNTDGEVNHFRYTTANEAEPDKPIYLRITGSYKGVISKQEGARVWNVDVADYKAYAFFVQEEGDEYVPVICDWNSGFQLQHYGAESLAYNNMNSSTFWFWGKGEGKTIHVNKWDIQEPVNMSYEARKASPLVYVPKCGNAFFTQGIVYAAFSDDTLIDVRTYPKRNVEMEFTSSPANDCDYSITVRYNGVTENM